MKLYQLCIGPDESEGDEVDNSQWFTALGVAKRTRAALIAADIAAGDRPRYDAEYEIREVTLMDLPRLHLALAILNRRLYIASSCVVVQPWVPPPDADPT